METIKRKQGDVHPETGLVFWSLQASCRNGERWMTQEKFLAKKLAIREQVASKAGRASIAKRRNTDAERQKRNEYAKAWRTTEERRVINAAYARRRRMENPLAALADRARARLREALRTSGISKRSSTSEMLGCTWAELVAHLESHFLPGMTWENRSQWEIDHRIPLSSASGEAALLRLCHYTNLRPLWMADNRKKGARMPECLDKAIYLRRAIAEIDAQELRDIDDMVRAGKSVLPEDCGSCGNVGARGMLKVILPWPARVLHPNARPHWRVKAKAAKAARATAYALALQAGAMRMQWPDGRLHLWVDFYPPDRRRRDDDGLLASVKAARDGLADAMGIDDHRFVSHPMLREEVRKGGEVVMTVTGGPCAA